MLRHRLSLRPRLAALTGLATLVALVAVAPQAQALSAPGSLKAAVRNSTTVILSWSPAKKASGYLVQVDSSNSFASPEYSVSTTNTKAVPTVGLAAGKNYWRVRSVASGKNSAWKSGSFTVAPVTTPIPLAPSDGQALAQPQNPPLLQWTSSQGAVGYIVEVDGDADMIGAKTYTVKGTSLVVPDVLTAGDWYWRVTATKGAGLNSLPSAVSRFDIQALPAPQITYPANDINQPLEDVVLDWTPVPGAKTYDVQVALDQDFNNIALNVTNVKSTRYSPPTTLNNDQFWWRVRAVDLAGQPTVWTTSLNGFQRQWPETPQPKFPLGSTGSPTEVTDAKQFYQWTPVKHATTYELQVSPNTNFSPAVTDTCKTASTTYTPRGPGDCSYPTGATVMYWRVRPIDLPYPSGLPGLYSTPQAFTYTPPPPPAGVWDPAAQVTGLKIALDGTGIGNSAQGCAPTSSSDVCNAIPSTPVLSWDPVPGAVVYLVYYGQDVNFTTSAIPVIPITSNTMFQLNTDNSKNALPESQAGSAYYWHIRPCHTATLTDCGIDPASSGELPDTRAFRKQSPAVANPFSSNSNSSEITFNWDDYYDTNVGASWGGQSSNQTAKQYRIQVDNDASFASPLDTSLVDQTTYTEYNTLYPDGTYFWRVQAVDAQNNGLTWSPVQTFTKTSPPVTPSSPTGGVHVSGSTPFRWSAEPFAASYTVEVYKNNDLTFSPANRVLTASVLTTAYAPPSPLPASGTNYVWRVRRIDASNNPGPWSATGTFYSTGASPRQLRPKAGSFVGANRALFEWTQVAGAASYVLNVQGAATSSTTTVATAFAPTQAFSSGKYKWSVTAKDSAGNPLGTSTSRGFTVDATAPMVTKVTPTKLKPTSTIKAKFSEKVKGISKKSIKLFKVNGTKKVHIQTTVTVLKKGKIAKINPKSRLKPGNYLLVFVSSKIHDRAGNSLAPSTVTPVVRPTVDGSALVVIRN